MTPKIKCANLEEAKKIIREKVDQGIRYNKIAKIPFLIDGRVKRFNPSEISKAKNKNPLSDSKFDEKSQDAKVMDLLKQGYTPTNIIIKTGFSKESVIDIYETYQNLEDYAIVPKHFLHTLTLVDKIICQKIHGSEKGYEIDFERIADGIADAFEAQKILQSLSSPCSGCGRMCDVAEDIVDDIKEFLTNTGTCYSCS